MTDRWSLAISGLVETRVDGEDARSGIAIAADADPLAGGDTPAKPDADERDRGEV